MRQITAIFAITLFVASMTWVKYYRANQEPAMPSPEAQMDDTLLIDHSRIPDSITLKARAAEWRDRL